MRKCYWKEDDQLTSVTIGKFDGFHKGHQKLLRELLKCEADTSVVCKIDLPGPGLLTKQEQEEYLSAAGIDRLVRLPFTADFARQTPEDFVRLVLAEQLEARHVIVGTDFRFGYQRSGDIEALTTLGKQYGFSVHPVEKLEMDGSPVSSTRIRAAYEKGSVEEAEHMLGHEITFSGMVRHGRELGRTIGFPTLNLIPDEEKLLPRFGVYESVVTTTKGQFRAVSNIGVRPTVNDGTDVTIESHLGHFSEDLYGEKIFVRLVRFIRPEMRFDSVGELKDQMKKDACFL